MKEKKFNLSTKVYLFIIIIFITLIALLSLKLINKKVLDYEIKNTMSKNILKDSYNTNTKTFGKNKDVELAVKKYMSNYAQNMKKINKIINDKSIKNILSSSNYNKDKPAFNNSLKVLNNKISDFDETISILLKMREEETIMSYIEDETDDSDAISIYRSYMFNKTVNRSLEEDSKEIDNISIRGKKILEDDIKVITLLKNNPNAWVIKDNEINFYSTSVMLEYNNLVKEIQSNME